MNFNLSEEQEMLREGAARFVRDKYAFERRRPLNTTDPGDPPDYWQYYAELGWLALNIPEDVGGLGCSLVETVIVMEQLGRALAVAPFVSSAVLCATLIDRSKSQVHRQHILPGIAAGKLLLALADTDAIGSHTAATCIDGGYRIDGRKAIVIDGACVDQFLVTAQLDDAPVIFIVPHDAPGVQITPYLLLNGFRAADVCFSGVELDASCLLLSGKTTRSVLDEALDNARIAYLAAMIGSMEASMELTAEHIKQRQQFGHALSTFQALQHVMADMFVDTQQSRSMLYFALASIAQPERRARAVSAAKAVVGAAALRVGGSGIQLHGGYGMTDEYAISHHYRHLVVLDRLYGSANEHLAMLEPSAD